MVHLLLGGEEHLPGSMGPPVKRRGSNLSSSEAAQLMSLSPKPSFLVG